MNNGYVPQTQFSIYKIDCEEVEAIFKISHSINKQEYTDKIISSLINSTTKIIKNKKIKPTIYEVKNDDFSGLIFKTNHIPIWRDLAQFLILNNEIKSENKKYEEDFILNGNVSYILFYALGKNVYALTGGYGSNYISKFCFKNFGLYLLPKILKKDSTVLKQITVNKLTGNQASSSRANRKSTNFHVEQDMSSVFRQLNVERSEELTSELQS